MSELVFQPKLGEAGRLVRAIGKRAASELVVANHYLHRAPPISYAFGLIDDGNLVGVCTFGIPASRHLQVGVLPDAPDAVLELNRLWVRDEEPHNTESWFVARCLRALPPRALVSYADTRQGHVGYIYRALSWRFAGWTDMDRKTPRLDYLPISGGHTRDAARSGTLETVRREPKMRYWTTTGRPAERRELASRVQWPDLDWNTNLPPLRHYGA